MSAETSTSTSDAITLFQAYVDLINSERETIWARHNALLVANSLIVGALAISPAALWQNRWAALALLGAAGVPAHAVRADVSDAAAVRACFASAAAALGGPLDILVNNAGVFALGQVHDRANNLAELDRIGAQRDLSWIYAEAPALVPELPNGPDTKDPHRTVLSMARSTKGTASSKLPRKASRQPN